VVLTSRRWTPPRPVNAYVIEHAQGLILFDTGQDRASVTDDAYFPGGFTALICDRLARFYIGEQDTLTAQLAALGYTPADVDTAILSHLHQDHIGGIAELNGADLLVSAAEWAELSKAAPGPRGFLPEHIQVPGSKWHQLLERRQVPGVGNRRQLAQTTGKVLALKEQMPDLVILPAHDPTAAARLLGS
jgi:glyoxylase-like metal-dependent hydrolase (beta-lactamase superfamily II)